METPEPLPGVPGPIAEPLRPAGHRTVRCALCGRPLTSTESRRTGLGPACDAALHPPGPNIRHRRHEVEQEPLPGT
ncbi:DUF6011 domain-containing protein [Streptomyces sp. bgisy091]|uniref:DUF6011 domain-containing protein n=1 Tax=Streptomyces sp. bgisy091 TaxID=3413778 RepID=UPI003D75B944